MKKHFDSYKRLNFTSKEDFDEFRRVGFPLTREGKADYDTSKRMGFDIQSDAEGIKAYLEAMALGYPATSAGRLEFLLYKKKQRSLGAGFCRKQGREEEYEPARAWFPSLDGKVHFHNCKIMGFTMDQLGGRIMSSPCV